MQQMNIALFASGTGSNVYNIIQYFKANNLINVVAVLSNKENAGALKHAKYENISTLTFSQKEFISSIKVEEFLAEKKVDLVILAGFLLRVPETLLDLYPNKIINVHPALLPNYGGKGMYGMHVHNAVIAAKEKKSGITIHLVNEKYDDGAAIAQFECSLNECESAQGLAQKISVLEKTYFPKTIEEYILKIK
jgi:phosphoribosylglycinamide formyltransferase 1